MKRNNLVPAGHTIAVKEMANYKIKATDCGNMNCNSGIISYRNGKNVICKKCNPDYGKEN